MSEPTRTSGGGAHTLPQCLRLQAHQRGAATALRHKQRGLWRSKTWRELEAEVGTLASALSARGFGPGDRLLIDAPAVPEACSLGLAVSWLGGALVTVEPAAAPGPAAALDASGIARFVLVADDAARARHVATRAPLALGIVLDGDGTPLEDDAAWISFEALARSPAPPAPPPVASEGTRAALLRWHTEPSGGGDSGTPSAEVRSHDDLVRAARALASRGLRRTAGDAIAGRELTLGDRLEHLLPVWLVAGLCWSFVEHPTSEDADRRELGPSVVFGSARDFASLGERVSASLPARERGAGRWLHAALDARSPFSGWARRLLTARLREVTGFARAQRVIAIGGSAEAAPGFEHLFGLSLFEWPDAASLERKRDVPASAVAAARSSRQRVVFDAAELSSEPRSDVG